MAILRRSRSGKALLFVDDDGNVFMTSIAYAQNVLNGNFKGFCILKRFPQKVREDLFQKSPLVGEEFSKAYDGKSTFESNKGKVNAILDDRKMVGDLSEW